MMTVQEAFDLALQHHQAGRWADAEALCRQILAVQPRHGDALHLLGIIAGQVGQYGPAIDLIGQAIAINPDNPAAHSHLGSVYRAMGRLDEAIAAYRLALDCDPRSLEVQCNLGNALKERGHLDEAIAAYRLALQIAPDHAVVHYNLGIALGMQGKWGETMAASRRALELKPDFAEAHNNLGHALAAAGQLDAAIEAFHQALRHQPRFCLARCNLGNALKDQGQIDGAIAEYREALLIKPDCAEAWSNLLYALLFVPGNDEATLRKEFRGWNEQFDGSATRASLPHSNVRHPDRRLRIGYVSPDLCDHVIGRNLRPLFHHHHRQDFHIICYSGAVKPDELTEEFRRHSDQWRSIVGVGDETLCDLVQEDEVDILVDLTQHLAGNRLVAFTRRPVPILVSFAGYPESAGVEAIGNRISDPYLEANEIDGDATGRERFVREMQGESVRVHLLDSFWCYDPRGSEIQVNDLPAQEYGAITFGSLNNFCKVNGPLLKLWAGVLKTMKNSRLIILSHEGSHRQRTLQFLESEGVEPSRVEFATPRPRKEYLELHHRLDIVLDTFPYNGHTTSLDALWMGVPVVSLCGKRPVSRGGLSQLSNLGLPELTAFTEDEYIDIATQLANDLPRLAELRRTLRPRMENSVLMDGPHFARQIEACYRSMWRQWCESQTASGKS